jgi:hypothetical protein
VGEAAENQGKLEIAEFSISPLEVSSGQQIDLNHYRLKPVGFIATESRRRGR